MGTGLKFNLPQTLGGANGTGQALDSSLPNITGVAQNNEMCFVVADIGSAVGYAVQLTAGGTYAIDHGDGTIETITATAYTNQSTANGLLAQVNHTYDPNNSSGKGVWIANEGYYAYVVKIYAATSAIKYFKVARVAGQYTEQHNGIIWADINVTTLVDVSQMFSNGIAINPLRCHLLQKVRIVSGDNITTSDYFAYECNNFRFYNFPDLPNAVSRTYSFYKTAFISVTIGALYQGASICSMAYAFAGMDNLKNIVFTAPTWGSVSSISNIFSGNNALIEIVLPAGVGNNKLTACDNAFNNCYNVKSITNLQYLGSTISNTSFSGAFDGCENFKTSITIGAKLSKFTCKGTTNYKVGITGLIFTNATSTFGGTNPQLDWQYCDLSATALNNGFTSLPSVTPGTVTIKITGCTGAGTCDQSIATAKGYIVAN